MRWYRFKQTVKRFFLWFNISKRIKFKRALHKYADRVAIWEQGHDDPPPLVWSDAHKDYIWVNRFNRVEHQKQIKRATKLPFKKPNRR